MSRNALPYTLLRRASATRKALGPGTKNREVRTKNVALFATGACAYQVPQTPKAVHLERVATATSGDARGPLCRLGQRISHVDPLRYVVGFEEARDAAMRRGAVPLMVGLLTGSCIDASAAPPIEKDVKASIRQRVQDGLYTSIIAGLVSPDGREYHAEGVPSTKDARAPDLDCRRTASRDDAENLRRYAIGLIVLDSEEGRT